MRDWHGRFVKGHTTNIGRKPTEETIKKLSESHKGNKAWNWKGGCGKRYAKIVVKLHGLPFICQECGSIKVINIHHKDGNQNNNKLNNLCLLCSSCHHNKHNTITNIKHMRG